MKTKIVALILISFLSTSLISCKKEKEPVTKSEILTNGEWEEYKINTYTISDNLVGSDTDIKYFITLKKIIN